MHLERSILRNLGTTKRGSGRTHTDRGKNLNFEHLQKYKNPKVRIMKVSKYTLLDKYKENKAKYPNNTLIFTCGDFYEIYEEDARKAAAILNLHGIQRKDVFVVGFPVKELDTYLPKLIRGGLRCAIISPDEKNVENVEASVLETAVERIALQHKQRIMRLCTEIIKVGNLPDKLMAILNEEIGRVEVIRIKVDNGITPTLEDARYLLDHLSSQN